MRAQREIHRFFRALPLALVSSTLILAACQKSAEPTAAQDNAEVSSMRAALQRNPNIEVIATDAQAGVFTIRDKATGDVTALKMNDLAAAPIAQLRANARAPMTSATTTEPATSENGAAESGEAPASATATADSSAAPAPNYTIERSDSGVKVSGPGISIVSTGKQGTTSAKGEAGQRAVDPIICEGSRMVHLDNRRIFVDGDAITARAGCELHITNSRIVASGTGLVVQDATVHISNSYIEGGAGSFEAGVGARMFVRDTTFNGLTRRDAFAQITEQGGNQWR
jgi:hypothetical protein